MTPKEEQKHTCPNCLDTLWVCERHTDKPWAEFMPEGFLKCCGGAGQPCAECNFSPDRETPPKMPDDFTVLIDLDGDKRQ